VSKGFKVGFAVLLVALLAGIVLLVLREREPEPVVQGKRLGHWLKGYQKGMNPQARAKADEIIRQTGTNAIPTLLRMLRRRDPELKSWLIKVMRGQHLVRVNIIPDHDRHYQAALAFAQLGAAGRVAIPALIRIFDEDISPSSRFWSINALGSIGSSASNAVHFLISATTNSTTEVRLTSISALAEIRAEPELTVAALTNVLNDQEFMVRYYAVLALENLGAEAKEAVPALKRLLNDPDRSVRQRAAAALNKIERAAAER